MPARKGWATIAVGALVTAATVLPQSGALAAAVPGTDILYTSNTNFDTGTSDHVNHIVVADQLQLDKTQAFFPYVNVAASGRGTMLRIDVNTGDIVGEWWSSPDSLRRNPSRTTVDKFGNTWLTNRDQADGNQGSVTRIAVIQGGTRVNADGSPNATGDYLKPPFAYNTCQDRDNDGLIATSRGRDDIRAWSNAGGVDTDGGVETASDECLITYTRTAATNARTVAVDAENNVWVGGANTVHEKLSGDTGQPIAGTQINFGCGGYGGLIDKAGTLWSARFGNGLLRYVPSTNQGQCLGFDQGDYGLGIDPVTGEIWHTSLSGNRVSKIAADGALLGSYPHGEENAQGVAVDKDGNVWVAHALYGSTTVGHLRTDGTFVGNVPLPGGQSPTGVAVDSNGKVWVTNFDTSNAMRIDPAKGPLGPDGLPIGEVDLTVDLGAGANPYNYSDMTGAVLGSITAPQGSWSVVQDGEAPGVAWSKITWNTEAAGATPAGTSIVVEARASDVETDLAGLPFVAVTNAAALSLTGRFIEVRATLSAAPDGTSPILADLRVEGAPAANTGRFVTGGGWIQSPEGAYTPDDPNDADVTGKANIGFNARSTTKDSPAGVTEFQFKAGDLNLHSSSYDTLVINGNRAVFTGTGEVNKTAGYGFLVSVVDDGDTDMLRVKIWKTDGGAVLYDSQPGNPDLAPATTPLGGGSIVIHS